jgi:UDP-N-acetylglucosamine 1-carboxyvinyltransferase
MSEHIFEIEGPRALHGRIRVAGSKNASLPMMTAALLADGPTVLENVPDLRDTQTMATLLRQLGAHVTYSGDTMVIDPAGFQNHTVEYSIMSAMRASIYAMGPLLAVLGRADICEPGGCSFGDRPTDLHKRGFRALGAIIQENSEGFLVARARKLYGARMSLLGTHGTSVGATINVMMAAVRAEGETVINHAALEPEVSETGKLLQAMGADIEGLGTSVLRIRGVRELKGVTWRVISDRIEAGTFAVAALATGGDVVLEEADLDGMRPLLRELMHWGAEITVLGQDSLRVAASSRPKRPLQVTTLPFPQFPTDMQSVLAVLLALTPGKSEIIESVYPDRFGYVPELQRMGAEIEGDSRRVTIEGVRSLYGADVMACDLRAGAALVVAGLAAEGVTTVRRIHLIERGYERLDERMRSLGALMKRVPAEALPAAG